MRGNDCDCRPSHARYAKGHVSRARGTMGRWRAPRAIPGPREEEAQRVRRSLAVREAHLRRRGWRRTPGPHAGARGTRYEAAAERALARVATTDCPADPSRDGDGRVSLPAREGVADPPWLVAVTRWQEGLPDPVSWRGRAASRVRGSSPRLSPCLRLLASRRHAAQRSDGPDLGGHRPRPWRRAARGEQDGPCPVVENGPRGAGGAERLAKLAG